MNGYSIGIDTILHTKDGNKIGNAIVTGRESYYWEITTDYGNKMQLTSEEIDEYFNIAYANFSKEIDGFDCNEMQSMMSSNHKHSIEQRMPLEQTLVKFRESVSRMTKDSFITAYSQDALELLTLMTRYDCRPSEIVGIVRLNDNVGPSLCLGNYRNKIVDIKINRKD